MSSIMHGGHSHASSSKADGWAFTLNLVRSLCLWTESARWPSDVQKPPYLAMSPSGSLDWTELLRKFTKHNSGSLAQLRAATTRLELAIWRAVAAQDPATAGSGAGSLRTTDVLGKIAKERREATARLSRRGSLDTPTMAAAPDELLVRGVKGKIAIQSELAEVEKLNKSAYTASFGCTSTITVQALALYCLGRFPQSCVLLEGLAEDRSQSESRVQEQTHDADLHILALTLHGMCFEQQAQTAEPSQRTRLIRCALERYQQVPLAAHPAPMPEAQRYAEMSLYRRAQLEDPSGDFLAHRNYISLMSSSRHVSPHRRERMYWSYLYSRLQGPALEKTADADDFQQIFLSYEHLLFSTPILSKFPRAGDPTYPIWDYIDLVYCYWARGLLAGGTSESASLWAISSLNKCLTATYACQKLIRYLMVIYTCLSFSTSDRMKGKTYSAHALRNLRLYIMLFEKSRETDQISVQHEIRSFRERLDPVDASIDNAQRLSDQLNGAANGTDNQPPRDGFAELETDDDFCATCCVGTRLLLRESTLDGKDEGGDERIELVHEALGTMFKAYRRLHGLSINAEDEHIGPLNDYDFDEDDSPDVKRTKKRTIPAPTHERNYSPMTAEVDLWLGIAKAEYALAEGDPEISREKVRQGLQSIVEAVNVMKRNIDTQQPHSPPASNEVALQPSLSTRALYSLAYAQLEVRDVAAATQTARRAIESIPSSDMSAPSGIPLSLAELRVWHLFILTLTAKKEWSRARKMADLALEDSLQPDIVNGGANSSAQSSSASTSSPSPAPRLPMPQRRHTEVARMSLQITSAQTDAPRSPLLNGPKSPMFTRADAPYDPAATGGAAPAQDPMAAQDPISPTEADSDYGTAESSSSQVNEVVSHRPGLIAIDVTSAWDQLEAETELWITRNKCIEALDGPEIALHDLQSNVFIRFSRRRAEIEDLRQMQPENRSSTDSKAIAVSFPYSDRPVRTKDQLAHKLEQSETRSIKARSIRDTLGRRHRVKTSESERYPSGFLSVPQGDGRPSSIRSTSSNRSETTHRTASPTLTDTHGRQSAEIGRNPSVVDPSRTNTIKADKHDARGQSLLARLWLASAASFRRWGKLPECRGAIAEAEEAAGDSDPNVWVQYALYLKAEGVQKHGIGNLNDDERVVRSLMKATAISTDHIPTIVLIAKTHMEMGNLAIAEGFLDIATQSNAWDSPEAWFLLAKVYEETGRSDRARSCLIYALGLEETRPIRELRYVLQRYL